MALASQSTRTQEVARGSKNNYQSPRRKKKQRLYLIALLVVVVAGLGGYAGYRQFKKKSAAPATDPNKQASNSGPARPNPTNSEKSPAETNIPVEVPKPTQPEASHPDIVTMGAGLPAPQTKPDPATPVIDPLAPSAETPKKETPGVPPPAPIRAPTPSADDMPAEAAAAMDRAKRAMSDNKLVEARGLLNDVLANQRVKETEKEGIRSWLGEINQTLIFSPTVAANDPLTESYKVVSGDNLQTITRKRGLAIDRRLIARVNRMANPDVLHIGQTLKLVHGPFHAVVHKTQFRVDLYAGTPLPPGDAGTPRPDGSEEGWTFIRSFPVGLGENNATPLGTFVVKRNSKLLNPHWVNPRTGEKFDASDPKNPIGEHWLGLTGVDEKTKSVSGYGLHGTIDPDSIGQERSMGCVRMRADDIAVVWEMLAEEVSTVRIVE